MITLSEADFSGTEIKQKEKTIVLFTAHWCGFCKVFFPLFEKAEKENPNLKFSQCFLDDPDDPLYNTISVDVLPTIVAFNEGKETSRANGIPGFGLTKQDLEKVLGELRENKT
ncbi:MAG: thioredoxin family protein [Candidatus Aenigmarchaeota archaeon]|nr:thioredoxin family protein [Candidatus Aenigmarchaeota archaeon]